MRQNFLFSLLALLLAILVLGGCALFSPGEAVDPHAGMIEAYNGAETTWIYAWDAAQSTLAETDFAVAEDGTVTYNGADYRAQQGVDVSYFQGEIDWDAVRAAGIEFAYIRAGYRGYLNGTLYEDECFARNAEAARAAGLEIGLYFFSQAVSPEEAEEEARWLVAAAADYDVTLPLCFDWEAQISYDEDEVRTDGMLGAEITACAAAFCDAVRAAGYDACVYANRWQGYYDYDLGQLPDAQLWISAPGDWDDFYYAHSLWQYSYEGTVPGISTAVDRDLRFLPVTEEGATP